MFDEPMTYMPAKLNVPDVMSYAALCYAALAVIRFAQLGPEHAQATTK